MGKLEELEELTKSMKEEIAARKGFITSLGLNAKYVAFMKEYDALITRAETVILFTEPEPLMGYMAERSVLF